MAASTWRSKSGIIMFHVTMPSGGKPVVAIRRATATLLASVRRIGAAREMAVSGRSGGEDACTWRDMDDGKQIAQRLETLADITAALVRCDLHCEDRDDGRFVVPGGMTFWVQLAEIDSDPDEPLEINVTLDTDVYVARSW